MERENEQPENFSRDDDSRRADGDANDDHGGDDDDGINADAVNEEEDSTLTDELMPPAETEHPSPQFSCGYCNNTFLTKIHLKKHLDRCSYFEDCNECPECEKNFETVNELNNHTCLTYTCIYKNCEKSYKSKDLIVDHMLSCEMKNRKKCERCNLNFPTIQKKICEQCYDNY